MVAFTTGIVIDDICAELEKLLLAESFAIIHFPGLIILHKCNTFESQFEEGYVHAVFIRSVCAWNDAILFFLLRVCVSSVQSFRSPE